MQLIIPATLQMLEVTGVVMYHTAQHHMSEMPIGLFLFATGHLLVLKLLELLFNNNHFLRLQVP